MDQDQIRIEYTPLSTILKWERNPKLHADEAIGASIGRFGFVSPIVVNERTGILVDGYNKVSVRGVWVDIQRLAP